MSVVIFMDIPRFSLNAAIVEPTGNGQRERRGKAAPDPETKAPPRCDAAAQSAYGRRRKAIPGRLSRIIQVLVAEFAGIRVAGRT
jgi:hypothetical protein